MGYNKLTSLGSSTALPSVPDGATRAVFQAESQVLRYRDDGTAPTSTTGMRALVGELYVYEGNLSALRFIEEASGGALNVSYYA
jgi:hypothetical protein